MKKSQLAVPLVVIAAALALTACGGGGSSGSGGGEEAAIEETIEKAATTTDPSKCTEFQTEEFNEQEKGSGSEATERCEEDAEGHELPAESVAVSNISVEGETATAEAAVHGSALNGQTIEVELAKEDGKWKLNRFLAFTKFDAKALGEGVEEGLEAEGGMSASEVGCFGDGISELSQEEAEEVAFEGAGGPIEGFAESCE